jgi:small subunit ribosomal protein S17
MTDAPQPPQDPTAEGAQEEAGAETAAVAPDTPAESGEGASAEAPAEEATPPIVVQSTPAEELSPKERRRRERARHTGKAHEPRSPEQHHAERLAARRLKAEVRRATRQRARAKRRERGGSSSSRHTPSAAATPAGEARGPASGTRKVRQGVVVSDKADKTITVRISSARRHRRYEKIVRSSRTLHAHDEQNEAHEGDVVRLVESRPLSRTKRWRLVEVLERAR